MTLQKILVYTCLVLMIMPFVIAADVQEVTNPFPYFNITYDEDSAPITIVSGSPKLFDIYGTPYELSYQSSNADESNGPYNFLYRSFYYLPNNLYTFEIEAEDFDNNPQKNTYQIQVNVAHMPIFVRSPTSPLFSSTNNNQDFAVGTTLPFNITLESAGPVICKIKLNTNQALPPEGQWNQASVFFNKGSSTPTTIHNLTIVANPGESNYLLQGNPLNYANLFSNSYAVICKQDLGFEEKYHLKIIYVGYDNTPPQQIVSFAPALIEDYANVTTQMQLQTTGDRVACSYKLLYPNSQVQTGQLPVTLTGFNDLFSQTEKIFLFNNIKNTFAFGQPYVFMFTTNCTNPAGLSTINEEQFTIRLSNIIRLSLLKRHFSIAKPTLTLTTNLASTCWHQEGNNTINFTTTDGLTHSFSSKTFSEGNNPFAVECFSDQGSLAKQTFTIVIDTKAPLAPVIKSGADHCEPRFTLDIAAPNPQDRVSYNISLYNSSTTTDANRIAGPETTTFTNNDLTFTIKGKPTPTLNRSYMWTVFATDEAGNKGATTKHTIKAVPFDSLSCDITSPLMVVKSAKTSAGYEVNITCKDAESGCTDAFLLSKLATNQTCNFTQGISTPYASNPVIITSDAKICYTGIDKAGNKKTGQLVLTLDALQRIESGCENGFKDAGEEGIDCGGVCEAIRSCPPPVTDTHELGQDDDTDTETQTTPKTCIDDFDCVYGEQCIQGICQKEGFAPPEQSSFLPWLLIILGVLLMLGGVGYIIYAEQQKQTYQQQKMQYQQSAQETAAMAAKRLADEKKYLEELKKKREAGEEKRSKLSLEKKSKRSELLGAFENESTASPEEKESSSTKEDIFASPLDTIKDLEKTTTKESSKEKKLDDGASEEFILLDELDNKKKQQKTSLPKSDSKDVFKDLEKLAKETPKKTNKKEEK